MRKGRKYQVGDHWFTKKKTKLWEKNQEIIVIKVYKKGRKTMIDARDIEGRIIKGISVKKIRKNIG